MPGRLFVRLALEITEHDWDAVQLGQAVDFLVEDGKGDWRLPPGSNGELPLMFSLVARKPA